MAYITYTNAPETRVLYRTTQAIWYLLDVIEVILGFRFLLKLLGASSGAGFSQLVYNLSYPFMAPFLGVFRTTSVVGSTIEWQTLLAMLVYYIIAWGIVRLLLIGKPLTTTEADYNLRRQDIIED